MNNMDYRSRLVALRRVLKKQQCDALVIGQRSNLQYLCGFTGTAGMAVVLPDKAFFLTDFRYQAQAAQQVPPEYSVVIAQKGLWAEAAAVLKTQAQRIGIEAEHTSVATYEEICGLLAPAAVVSTRGLVETLRERKDDGELAIMRRAIKIADATFDHLCSFLRPGLVERDVALEIEAHMKSLGASGTSFESIVASGARGALPHGVASDKVLQAGEMVTIDMGARYHGYCSDMTRTVCLGKPTREQQKIYEIVWRAQTTAAAAMKPGLGCKAVDKIARDVIAEAGYGEFFGHGLGHGVGLQIHESPRLSVLGKGKLQVGQVVSCEPGIYIPDWGGVRIEDLVLITSDGSQLLSKARKPKKILVL
jgi:Xaa-Pro aminopeptidase